jgi:hypoxanthine phosphoribosyltransferase
LTIGEGGFRFAGRLIRQLIPDVALTTYIVSVFTSEDENKQMIIAPPPKEALYNKRVLIVDDLAASGQTIHKLQNICRECGAKEIKVCVLLDAPEKREPEFRNIVVDYKVLESPGINGFFVGQGMDYKQKCREAEYIGILKK